MLINSVKDVASALGDLIHATKSASGKSINDPAMIYLKDSAKVSYCVIYRHNRRSRPKKKTINFKTIRFRTFFFLYSVSLSFSLDT